MAKFCAQVQCGKTSANILRSTYVRGTFVQTSIFGKHLGWTRAALCDAMRRRSILQHAEYMCGGKIALCTFAHIYNILRLRCVVKFASLCARKSTIILRVLDVFNDRDDCWIGMRWAYCTTDVHTFPPCKCERALAAPPELRTRARVRSRGCFCRWLFFCVWMLLRVCAEMCLFAFMLELVNENDDDDEGALWPQAVSCRETRDDEWWCRCG